MADLTLASATPAERAAFTDEQVADYAAWLVERKAAASLDEALVRARAEIEPEMAAAPAAGDAFWTARDAQGVTVGWLWVQMVPRAQPTEAAFLYQISVRPEVRRRGYGTAMLAALEQTLARAGYRELRLNVWDTNEAGQRLYARAGYECVAVLEEKRQLRQRLRA